MTTPNNAAPTVTPSTLNTPKNGAASQTQQPVEPKPNSAAPADPLAEREAKLAERERAIEKREKTFGNELSKFKDTNKGLGAKLSEYEQLKKWRTEKEQEDQLATLNPPEFLKKKYGEKWHDVVNEAAVNGLSPNQVSQFLAAELQKLRTEFRAELESRDQQTKEQATVSEQASIGETRAMVATEAKSFYEANAKDYPVFEKLGDAQRIGAILGQRIEAYFNETGKILAPKEAADALESDMLGIVEAAVASEKYKSKLQGKLKPANVSNASGQPAGDGSTGSTQPSGTRRTLSNDLTASTSGRAPPRSDAERFQRSMDAFNAARAKSNA